MLTLSNDYDKTFTYRIGILYDEFMLQHRNLWDPNFPEKPDRLKTCFNSLKSLKLQDRFVFLKVII